MGDPAPTPLVASEERATLDPESQRWVEALRSTGAERDEALARLHELLLRAARFEAARRRRSLPDLSADEAEEIAAESADEAAVAVLARLGDFRGASRFTTWAYKFALFEAGVKVRRRAWRGRTVSLEPEDWSLVTDRRASPAEEAEHSELLEALREGVERVLTPRQREVFVALALNGVPIDVLAEHLSTTRGALYKTLHDARRKLRDHLARRGLGPEREERRR